jgi:hypothetical protein
MKRWLTPKFKLLLWTLLIIASVYGSIRLYYRITDGFTISNIQSDFSHNPRWDVSPLNPEEQKELDNVISQQFHYLGKGCQSYVFLSEDGHYVLKLFKYQRFRTQPWLDYLSFIPAVKEYKHIRAEKKLRKLQGFFDSWKIAFEQLRPETQLIYVHLNKSNNLNKTLTIFDKMGLEHQIALDDTEFLIQRKAIPLCSYIDELMQKGEVTKAKALLSRLIMLILSEYMRGIADNDHALMQNTGVYNNYPIHIDVGQFVINDKARDPQVYKQELFSKTYHLRMWLKKHHPELVDDFENELRAIIGPQFSQMKPYFKPHE